MEPLTPESNIELTPLDDTPAFNTTESGKLIHKQPSRRRKPVAKPQPQPELTPEAKDIENQISQYKNSQAFKLELQDIDFNNPNRQELLTIVEARCTNTVSFDYLQGVLIVFQQLENIANKKSGDRFTGLAKALYEDHQIRKNIELLRIKYLSKLSDYVNLPPEYALVLSMAAVSIRVFMKSAPKEELKYEE